jgi:DNA ligase D-like protein (predicted 3'-phosphoesterase)
MGEDRPRHGTAASGESAGRRRARFVVQRHDASTLHFNFRLEVDGVLVSWSVPKGPSLDPKDRRLAVRTEDHAVHRACFEGRVASGYGRGAIVVWDTGTYRNLTARDGDGPVPMDRALADGHLTVRLEGEKLSGVFTMTRTNTRHGPQEKWLIVKKDDEDRD